MTTYEEVLSGAQKLSPAEKARLLEAISAALHRDLSQAKAPKKSLYGLFADLGAAPSVEDM